MAIEIVSPETEQELTKFLLFHDEVYSNRSARWPVFVPLQLPTLSGQGPFAKDRTFKPYLAVRDGKIAARALAAIDGRHQERWGDFVGHLNMFEALPDAGDEARAVIDAASGWLADEGMKSARAGFGIGEFPFVIDDYETLPPPLVRQNPPYYHRMLKDSGFESEKGWVDYKIKVTPERLREWQAHLSRAKQRGFEIVPVREVSPEVRAREFTETWNDAFYDHWANSPLTEEEFATWFIMLEPFGFLDFSVIAYREGRPVGVVWAGPEVTSAALLAPGRQLTDFERVNFLGIGVRQEARGLGVNLAMASYSYVQLARTGHNYVSYTMVVDDNWPSRRTAEKLGAFVCSNYLVYRRDLARY